MFVSKDFTFNDIEGKSKGIYLVNFDSDVLVSRGNKYTRNISSDEYSRKNPLFNITDNEPEEVTLNFMYLDENMIPKKWTDEKSTEVRNWFKTDDFVPFVSQDNPNYVNYFMMTSMENKLISTQDIGVLEVVFKPLNCYVYKKYEDVATITSNTSINVNNPSNEEYKPILKITNLGNSATINKIGDLEISGLDTNETVIVDNLMLTVLDDNDNNKFSKCNRNWLTLEVGNNVIPVSGNFKLQILAEFPILL